MICTSCQSIFVGPLDESPRSLTLHKSTQSLYESAEAGCFICSLYWKRVQRTADRLAKDPLEIDGQLRCVLTAGHESSPWQASELLLQFKGDAVLPLGFWLVPTSGNIRCNILLACKPRLTSPEIAKFLATEETLREYPLSQSTRDLVRDWLETCRTTHVHCNQQFRPSRTPLSRSLIQKWLQSCRKDMAAYNEWTGSPLWLPICDLTQKWLAICNEDRSDHRPAWIPTRLIDLGTSNDQIVKLVDTRSTPTRGPYATLSHRWADSTVIQTTSSNIEQFSHAIPVTTLSKTFQDAFIAARSYLGIRYIWIDSLCIIQDDPQDWRAESVTMHDVYSRSLCNLSAIAASSGIHGLFPPRYIDRIHPCGIEINWAGRYPEIYIPIPKRFWDEQLDYAPLSRRGWVFQERWLAPRILHFSSDQLLWECSELNASEAYPRGIPEITCGTNYELHHELGVPVNLPSYGNQTMLQKLQAWLIPQKSRTTDGEGLKMPSTAKEIIAQSNPLGLPPIIYGTQSSFKNRISAPMPLKPSENYEKWQRLVEWYSSCRLTKEEDKLIAFSGIAQRFRSALGSEYLAGLWQDDLPNELIWRVSRAESDSVRGPTKYRAPSWSWASVDTQIINKFVDRELSPVITVTDCHIDHLPSNPFQVAGGWIRVRGTLHPALLYASENYSWDLKYNLVLPQTEKQLYAMPDAEPKTSDFSRRALRNPIIQGDRSGQMDELLDSFKGNGMFVSWYENPLYLLPVVRDVSQRGTFGIVLEPVVASERGTYKRWGWFEEAVRVGTGSSFEIVYDDKRKRKKKLYLENTYQELKIV